MTTMTEDEPSQPTGPVAEHDSHLRATTRRLARPFRKSRFVSVSSDDDPNPGDLLSRLVRDAGLHAFGTIAVEVWVMNPQVSKLERPAGGLWVDPAFLVSELPQNQALASLLDEGRTDYAPPLPLGPGVGLPGALWAETAEVAVETAEKWDRMDEAQRGDELDATYSKGEDDGTNEAGMRFSNAAAMRASRPMTAVRKKGRASVVAATADRRRVVWRQVGPLALDPDQPYNPRLILLAKAGLGLAAGVRFAQPGGFRGVVIYYARAKADLSKLRSSDNEIYLRKATSAIGACAALEGPRMTRIEYRRRDGEDAWRRARHKMEALMAVEHGDEESGSVDGDDVEAGKKSLRERLEKMKETLSEGVDEEDVKGWCSSMAESARNYLQKYKGGNSKPPPHFSNREALFSFLGSFVTLLVLSQINRFVPLSMGPFGAFATLLYGLTAAPASQPRNAILGQAVSQTISIAVSYSVMPNWAKQTVATSLAIGVMVRFGITHPPAGAAALIASTANQDWKGMGLDVMGSAVAVAVATIWNNLNDRRQYPTFWGIGHWWHMLAEKCGHQGKTVQSASAKKG